MKPRQLMMSIETTSGVPFDALRKARGGVAILKDANGFVICDLDVEQIQLNVIRHPKTAKKK